MTISRLIFASAALAFVLGVPTQFLAAETLPPAPSGYVADQAGVLPATVVDKLDSELAQFERQTSNQIVVALYPRMPANASLDDYSVRLFQAWHIGQRSKNNGALLLIFTEDHRIRIATGYGLEGALPDIVCKHIIDEQIAPRFRSGDFAGGVESGVHAMMAATRGEYRGIGRTNAEANGRSSGGSFLPLVIFLIIFMLITAARRRTGSRYVYGRYGRTIVGPPWWGGFGGGWSGGSSGGSFGSGGFSGGGGSTGGGGASGSW